MQKDNPFFDDLSRLASSATGAVMDMGRELERAVHEQVKHVLSKMDLVRREEFDVVKAMAEKARQENDALSTRIEALEVASNGKASSKKSAKS